MSRSCLSAEPHVDNIKESLLHFLGCVEISERARLLSDDSHPVWLFEIQHLINSDKSDDEVEKLMKQKRERWKHTCLNELRRIRFLRRKLEEDTEEKDLVTNVEESREAWRRSKEYQNGIVRVKAWKEDAQYITALQERGDEISHSNDFTKAIELVEKWKKRPGYTETNKISDTILDVEPTSLDAAYEPAKDVNVPIIRFKDGQAQDFNVLGDIDDKKVWGSFPNQKTTVEHLLDERNKENNILYREKHDKNTIEYYHLPSNNMTWAEQAVSRYFNEDRPDFHKLRRKIGTVAETEAAMILKESHWLGQLHGGRSSVHSRFMRPFCEALSSNVTEADHTPKDIVLFMPYLHWETSRNRERFAKRIGKIVDKHHDRIFDVELEEKGERRAARSGLYDNSGTAPRNESTKKSWFRHPVEAVTDRFTGPSQESSQPPRPPTSEVPVNRRPPAIVGRILSFGAAVERKGYSKSPVKVDETGRLRIVYVKDSKIGRQVLKGSRLGQYLIDAARLFEAITNYRDKCLLERYSISDAPVHPRRTLDQAFYWTLNSTRSRDEDQVVYRATTAKGPDFHQYDFKLGSWPKHSELGKDESCRDCTDKIKKISRIVMVDQLWMWILDAKTIITCFPDQYGATESHDSGIHKAIRFRVANKAYQHVDTVFDLALIILEECSNIFFDYRSEKQPQLLPAFSEAIDRVMRQQSVARDGLFLRIQTARLTGKSSGRAAGSNLVNTSVEFALDTEIRTIIDQIAVMLDVKKTNRDVLKRFIYQANEIKNSETGRKYGIDATTRTFSTPVEPQEKYSRTTSSNDDQPREGPGGKSDVFSINATKALERVNDQIDQLEELLKRAEATASKVKELLAVKQQQAGVVQAWQSTRQSDEANEQGRAIMIFTIVTTIFLPLSFMSSLFGMNTREFGGDDNLMHLTDQFRYIIGFSVPMIFSILVIALTNWDRSAPLHWLRFIVLWLCVRFGLYQLYLDYSVPNRSIYESIIDARDDLIEKQMKVFSERHWDKYKRESAKREQQKWGDIV